MEKLRFLRDGYMLEGTFLGQGHGSVGDMCVCIDVVYDESASGNVGEETTRS